MPSKTKRTILFTGGTGFLGSNILKKLTKKDFTILLLVRTSSNLYRIDNIVKKVNLQYIEKTDFDRLFKENKIDIVIHCATNYGRNQTSPLSILESNLILPLKLLQIGADNGLSCFINTDTILDKGVSYYSLSKNQFKDWLQLYSTRMVCVNVALEHFYGPVDDKSKFVAWIIHSMLTSSSALNLTPGEQKRDFIYIDDVVAAFLSIIKATASNKKGFISYEIGSGKTVSIRELVVLIKKLTRNDITELNFGALPYREKEVMESKTDLTNIQELGWAPQVLLETGIKKTIEYEKKVLRL